MSGRWFLGWEAARSPRPGVVLPVPGASWVKSRSWVIPAWTGCRYPGQGLDTLIAVEEPPSEESEGPAIDLFGDPEEVMEGAHGIQSLLDPLLQNAIAVVG